MGVATPKTNHIAQETRHLKSKEVDNNCAIRPALNKDDEQDITRVLNLFPEYHNLFHQTQVIMMSGDGSLPLQYRHFIAIMASR